jgi:hypothetical protein
MSGTVLVISCGEDGDKTLARLTKAELCDRLDEQWYGEDPQFASPSAVPDLERFVGLIIIDGDIIAPKPVEKVTRYKL